MWKAMSAEVLQASFDTTPDEIFFPPPSSASSVKGRRRLHVYVKFIL